MRLRKLDGLRVCDSAPMPGIPAGNTNAPTILIGEKEADLVLGNPPRPLAGEHRMIRHIVLIRPRPGLQESELNAIEAKFRALHARLDGFLAYHGGSDVNFEGLDRGYRYGHVLDFADQDARMRYHEDPEHKLLGARLVAAAEGGVDGLLVVDFAVPAA